MWGFPKLGAPKWMIYNGKSYYSGWFRGYPDVRQPLLYVKKSLNHSTCLCFCNLCRAGHWDLSPDPALYVHAVSIEPALPPSTWAAQPHADPGVCILWHSLWCGFLILRHGQTGFWRFNSYHIYHRNTQLRHIMKHTRHFSISGDDRRVTLQFPSWWPNWSTWLGEAPPLHKNKQVLRNVLIKTLPEATLEFSAFLSQLTFRDEPLSKHSDCYVPVPLTIWSTLGWLTPLWVIVIGKPQVALLELVVGLLILRTYYIWHFLLLLYSIWLGQVLLLIWMFHNWHATRSPANETASSSTRHLPEQETNSRKQHHTPSLWLTNLWKSPGICDAESGNYGEQTLWSSSVQIRSWQTMRHLPIIVSCLFSNHCQLLSLNESLLDVSNWFWAFGSNVINLLKHFEQT